MSLLDAIKEYGMKKTLESEHEANFEELQKAAIMRFDQKKSALQEIAKTEGIKELIKFFQAEKESSLTYIRNGNNEKLKTEEIGAYKLTHKFLTFIENMTST